jgi:hypothetical protein
MGKGGTTDTSTRVAEIVQLLVDVGASDTVYADVYFRRASELLASVLPRAQYYALKNVERDIDAAVKQSQAAAMLQDWQRVETLTGQLDALRRSAQEKTALSALAAKVYELVGVSIDPFSPGLGSLPGHDQDLAALRDTLVQQLKALATADASLATLYDARRAFFARFALLSKRPTTTTSGTGSAELEQLAAQAAQQGDMAQLRRYAQELLTRQAKERGASGAPKAAAPAAVERATYRCPVDLAVPFSDEVVQRARALGLAQARTEPLPQAAPLFDYVIAHVWQPDLSGVETEREGTIRAAAVVEKLGFPKEVSEPVQILVGQFLRNPFVNSGGARYLPQFSAEEVLIEDFPEDQEPPATGDLLSALGLARRRALTRVEIDDALYERGATFVKDRLLLDPLEFRLVCIPHDLYMRFGRERGWGQHQQWTHFDGYQVLKNGTLRALVGGDVRHGGLSDLVSIAITDQRECVVARFAVVRRARQVARWQ